MNPQYLSSQCPSLNQKFSNKSIIKEIFFKNVLAQVFVVFWFVCLGFFAMDSKFNLIIIELPLFIMGFRRLTNQYR